jgi:hypothetical protein
VDATFFGVPLSVLTPLGESTLPMLLLLLFLEVNGTCLD